MVQELTTKKCAAPSISGIAMQIIAQNNQVRTTSAQSTPRVQQTSTNNPSSSISPDPTLPSLLPRKRRILHNIYNEDTTNSFCSSFFVLTNR